MNTQFNAWEQWATQQERDLDQHIADFKDGLNDDCDCGVCLELREIEAQDLARI